MSIRPVEQETLLENDLPLLHLVDGNTLSANYIVDCVRLYDIYETGLRKCVVFYFVMDASAMDDHFFNWCNEFGQYLVNLQLMAQMKEFVIAFTATGTLSYATARRLMFDTRLALFFSRATFKHLLIATSTPLYSLDKHHHAAHTKLCNLLEQTYAQLCPTIRSDSLCSKTLFGELSEINRVLTNSDERTIAHYYGPLDPITVPFHVYLHQYSPTFCEMRDHVHKQKHPVLLLNVDATMPFLLSYDGNITAQLTINIRKLQEVIPNLITCVILNVHKGTTDEERELCRRFISCDPLSLQLATQRSRELAWGANEGIYEELVHGDAANRWLLDVQQRGIVDAVEETTGVSMQSFTVTNSSDDFDETWEDFAAFAYDPDAEDVFEKPQKPVFVADLFFDSEVMDDFTVY